MWDLARFADRTALIGDDGQHVTYGEIEENGKDLLESAGGRCLVFSLCTNQIGSVAGYAGFLNNGIVPVLLNARMDRELLQRLMDNYKPACLWTPSDIAGQFEGCREVYRKYKYVLLRTEYGQGYPLHEELGLLLTTSGSTGSPKFVRQSYENIMANAEAIRQYLEIDETERPITTLPMNYTYGLSIINSHLLAGAAILLTDYTLMQKDFWKFMKEAGATSFGGVPYTYEMLEKLHFFGMNLPTLRYMTQAGGKLPPELHRRFAEYAENTGRKFIVMYGQCEATARMGYLPAAESLRKYGSMGIAIPGGRFTLIDAEDKIIEEADVTGELVYEGSNVTLGYAECGQDLIKGDERHGILRTGDMAKRDEEGYYYIVGRKKRFLKIYGNRVNLDEIDTMLKQRFNPLECASSGVDDHVYIFITDASKAEPVKYYIAGKTGLNHAAFQVVVIDSIPKNDAGKIQYRLLEKYFAEAGQER